MTSISENRIQKGSIMIVKMIFGSHLYGTNTPASDKDYKGVDMPTFEQIVLGKVPKCTYYNSTGVKDRKNTNADTDTEIYSLHEFIRQALQGQTGVFDMLHCPVTQLLETSKTWCDIIANREKFYSKNVHAFIGYAMQQASKYGIKGSRLDAAKSVIDWMNNQDQNKKISECDLDTFPKSEHIKFVPSSKPSECMIDVCGKKITLFSRVGYSKEFIEKFYKQYGDRALLASENKAIDWKAISHAFRAAFQTMELFTKHTISFPRPEAEYLKEIKLGKIPYATAALELDKLITEVKAMHTTCDLPDRPDYDFWEKFLIEKVKEMIHDER